jgi:hypothetical protein
VDTLGATAQSPQVTKDMVAETQTITHQQVVKEELPWEPERPDAYSGVLYQYVKASSESSSGFEECDTSSEASSSSQSCVEVTLVTPDQPKPKQKAMPKPKKQSMATSSNNPEGPALDLRPITVYSC